MVGVFAFPALLPVFLQEWSLNHTQAGWINGVYFAGYAVAVPILASLTDRLDARRIYIVFALVGMLAAVGFAMMAQGFWSGLLFRTLGGLGLAGTFIPGLKAIVDRVQGTSAQNRAVAFYTATFSLGTSLSFFSAGELGARFGWRWAFVFAAVASLTAMLLAAVVLQPQRKSAETRPQTHFLDFRPVLRNQAAMAYILSYGGAYVGTVRDAFLDGGFSHLQSHPAGRSKRLLEPRLSGGIDRTGSHVGQHCRF